MLTLTVTRQLTTEKCTRQSRLTENDPGPCLCFGAAAKHKIAPSPVHRTAALARFRMVARALLGRSGPVRQLLHPARS
jgi:hypothetical protein